MVRHVPCTEVRGSTIIKHLSQNGYAKIYKKYDICYNILVRGTTQSIDKNVEMKNTKGHGPI